MRRASALGIEGTVSGAFSLPCGSGWLSPLEPFSGAANEFGRCEQRPSSLLRVNSVILCLILFVIIVYMLRSLVIKQAVA